MSRFEPASMRCPSTPPAPPFSLRQLILQARLDPPGAILHPTRGPSKKNPNPSRVAAGGRIEDFSGSHLQPQPLFDHAQTSQHRSEPPVRYARRTAGSSACGLRPVPTAAFHSSRARDPSIMTFYKIGDSREPCGGPPPLACLIPSTIPPGPQKLR